MTRPNARLAAPIASTIIVLILIAAPVRLLKSHGQMNRNAVKIGRHIAEIVAVLEANLSAVEDLVTKAGAHFLRLLKNPGDQPIHVVKRAVAREDVGAVGDVVIDQRQPPVPTPASVRGSGGA